MTENNACRSGIGFGISSSIITAMGLIVGLYVLKAKAIFFIGSLMTIAVADSISDAFGIGVAQQAVCSCDKKSIIIASLSTFFSKGIVTLSFMVPFIFLPQAYAFWGSMIWGLILLIGLSKYIALSNNSSWLKVFLINSTITVIAIAITYIVQQWMQVWFV